MIELPETAYQLTNYFAKIKCEPTWRWPRREKPLETYDLFYIWDGAGIVTVNGHKYEVHRDCCFLFRPGDFTEASHQPDNPLHITYIHFQTESTPRQIPQRFRRLGDTDAIEFLLSRYVRMRLSQKFAVLEEARLILKQLMIILLRSDVAETELPGENGHAWREAILETANYVREHPASWLTTEDLAKRAQLSSAYFAKKFKELVGCTVREHVIRSRVERAAFLLHYGGLNVSETADALGYRDVYFFSRQYKKFIGKAPPKR